MIIIACLNNSNSEQALSQRFKISNKISAHKTCSQNFQGTNQTAKIERQKIITGTDREPSMI